MKRFYSLMLLAAVICLPMRADAYRDALKNYLQTSSTVNTEQYIQSFRPLAQSLFPGNVAQGEKIFAEYFEEQLIDDITDLYLPAYRRHVTQADLQELTNILSDPRYGRIQEHAMKIVNSLNQTEEYQQFMTKFQEAATAIVLGDKPQDIKASVSVSGEYARAFNQYYEKSGTKQIVMSSFQSIMDVMENVLISQGTSAGEAKRISREVLRYSERNLPAMLMSLFNKDLTLRDLQDLMQLTDTDAYRHTVEASVEMTSDTMQMGVDILNKMADWMDKRYPQQAAKLRKELESLRSVMGK